MAKEGDFSDASYILGVLSIVFGIIQPVLGFGIGISGLVLSFKNKSDMGKKAKILNIIGIVISAIIMLILIVGGSYLISKGLLPSNLK